MVYYMDLYYTMLNYPAIKINVRKYRKGQIKNGQSRDMATWDTQYEEMHNTTCVGHHYTQTNTKNVN